MKIVPGGYAWLATALAMGLFGCQSMPRNLSQISYRLDTCHLGLPLPTAKTDTPTTDVQVVGYQTQVPMTGTATLTITSPHPALADSGSPSPALANFALAELVIEAEPLGAVPPKSDWMMSSWWAWAKGTGRTATHTFAGLSSDHRLVEHWAMNIPKEDLDRIHQRLAAMGFYDSDGEVTTAVKVTEIVGDRKSSKRWSQVPELDMLAMLVRQRGALISATRQSTGGPAPLAESSSVLALRTMLAHDETAGIAVTPPGGPLQPSPVVARLPKTGPPGRL